MAEIRITKITQDTEKNLLIIAGENELDIILHADLTGDEAYEPEIQEYMFWLDVPGQMNCLGSCCFRSCQKRGLYPADAKFDKAKTITYIKESYKQVVWFPESYTARNNDSEETARKNFERYIAQQNAVLKKKKK